MSTTVLRRAVNGLFGGIFNGKRTQSVFSAVASKFNMNRPAASGGFVAPRSASDFGHLEPRGTLGAGPIFRAVRGMSVINGAVPKPFGVPLTRTVARHDLRQPAVTVDGPIGTVGGTKTRNMFSAVASKFNLNCSTASSHFVVAEHCRPALFVASRRAANYARPEPRGTLGRRHYTRYFLMVIRFNEKRSPPLAINGFGQTCRTLLRNAIENDVNVVVINEPLNNIQSIARLFKHDPIYGIYPGIVWIRKNLLFIDGNAIKVCHERNPENINWKKLGVEYVIDSTGQCTDKSIAMKHITSGAKKVIVTMPCKDVPTFFKGMNYEDYEKTMPVVSTGTSMANCLVPLLNILNKNSDIASCLVMPFSNTTSDEGFRYELKKASSLCEDITMLNTIPELDCTNTSNVAYLELHLRFKSNVCLKEIKLWLNEMVTCTDGVVTSFRNLNEPVMLDFVTSRHSAIIDVNHIVIDGTVVKIGVWYHKDRSFACRAMDLAKHIMAKDKNHEHITFISILM